MLATARAGPGKARNPKLHPSPPQARAGTCCLPGAPAGTRLEAEQLGPDLALTWDAGATAAALRAVPQCLLLFNVVWKQVLFRYGTETISPRPWIALCPPDGSF